MAARRAQPATVGRQTGWPLPPIKATSDLMKRRRIIMRSLFFAGIALAGACGLAAAADMPRSPRRPATPLPPETSVYLGWSGFYLGLNAGGRNSERGQRIQRARRSRLCVGEQLPFRRDRWRPGRVQLANRHDGRRRRGGFLGKRSERRLERALPGRPLRPGFGGDV
jgi:hypothetical protein